MSSTIPSSVSKPPALSKRAEPLPKVAMILAGPLFLLGLLEGVAYAWERTQANTATEIMTFLDELE